MWPSFSLCAWRILKIRSCLRNPLAPGKSKDRAILVSSVIFFSLSSAMVINHLREDFSKGGTQKRRIHRRGRKEGEKTQPRPVAQRNGSGRPATAAPPALGTQPQH